VRLTTISKAICQEAEQKNGSSNRPNPTLIAQDFPAIGSARNCSAIARSTTLMAIFINGTRLAAVS